MLKKDVKFSKRLISWYLENKRELPWRTTKNPYAIWLSEIILQQTRVAQGLPYYQKFISQFPTVYDLAAAPQEKVLKLWQGLGYYSRARNLHETAKNVVVNHKGKFPDTYKALLNLKGVGDYTASAIASICYKEATAVVDGNVYRVLSRIFGIETPINTTKGQKEFKALAQQLLDPEKPGTNNQAIMEFGARYCLPQSPNCSSCIFNDSCEAYRKGEVSSLPVKLKKLKIKNRYFNYLVFISEDNQTCIEQRTHKGIWQQLYQFPLIETKNQTTLNALRQDNSFLKLTKPFSEVDVTQYNDEPIVHKLSHQHLHVTFWIISISEKLDNGIAINTIDDYAVPVLISNFISEFSVFNNLKN